MSSKEKLEDPSSENTIVQYIALRNDLKWPKGALIAQVMEYLKKNLAIRFFFPMILVEFLPSRFL